MNAPGNRSRAVRDLVRSVMSWPIRERPAPALDRLVRRGGGLLVLTALSMFAGWSITRIPVGDDASAYPAERCLVVVGVARFGLPGPERSPPVMLVQTAWLEAESTPSSPVQAALCDASERALPVPPIANVFFRWEGAVFVPSPFPAPRASSFAFTPVGFGLHTSELFHVSIFPEET